MKRWENAEATVKVGWHSTVVGSRQLVLCPTWRCPSPTTTPRLIDNTYLSFLSTTNIVSIHLEKITFCIFINQYIFIQHHVCCFVITPVKVSYWSRVAFRHFVGTCLFRLLLKVISSSIMYILLHITPIFLQNHHRTIIDWIYYFMLAWIYSIEISVHVWVGLHYYNSKKFCYVHAQSNVSINQCSINCMLCLQGFIRPFYSSLRCNFSFMSIEKT